MDKNSNTFTLGFATLVCVVLAIGLAATYNGLKGRMDANVEFDRHQNVLIALGLYDKSDTSKSRADVEALFRDRVVGVVLEVKRGRVKQHVMRGGKPVDEDVEAVVDVVKTDHEMTELADLRRAEARKPEAERREFAEIFKVVGSDGKTAEAWCIPISGYGLWSWLYGYLALDKDLRTVHGITFYKDGETPGLGGEVNNRDWQKTWRGKTILDDRGQLVSVRLKKGHVTVDEPGHEHEVDGLSGATITSKGVTRFVKANLATYEPYFKKLRKQ